MDRNQIPVERRGNGAQIRTLTYDASDSLMLAHAMLIASTRAMMSGSEQAHMRLNHYREQFLQALPEGADAFSDTDMSEIGLAAAEASAWRLDRPLAWRERSARATLTMDGRSWRTKEDVDDQAMDTIRTLMSAITPSNAREEEQPEEMS